MNLLRYLPIYAVNRRAPQAEADLRHITLRTLETQFAAAQILPTLAGFSRLFCMRRLIRLEFLREPAPCPLHRPRTSKPLLIHDPANDLFERAHRLRLGSQLLDRSR
jgi:hypothetical protein